MTTEVKPHKFIAWTLLGFFAGVIFILTPLFLSFNSRPEAGRWVYECLQKKNAAVQQIQPKLIILSGSNSLFGFSAERLTKKYGVPAVNAAIYAGLGMNYILYYGKKYIAPGRIFVLPLEYELYSNPGSSASEAYLYQILGFDPAYFASMSLVDKTKFLIEIPWTDRLRILKNLFRPKPRNDIEGYQSRTLNAWGDETNNMPDNRNPIAVTKVTMSQVKLRFSLDEDAWDAIAKFVLDVRLGGGDVVLTYPNIFSNYLDTEINSEFFADLARRANEINVKFVGSPDAARFDESLLFDTYYHQNTVGQAKSTDRLYEDLLATGIIRQIPR